MSSPHGALRWCLVIGFAILIAILLAERQLQAASPETIARVQTDDLRPDFYYGAVVEPGERVTVKFKLAAGGEIAADVYRIDPGGGVSVFGGWNNKNPAAPNVDWSHVNESAAAETYYVGAARLGLGWVTMMPKVIEHGSNKQVVRFHVAQDVPAPPQGPVRVAGGYGGAEAIVIVEKVVPPALAPETQSLRTDLAKAVTKSSGVFEAIEAKLKEFDARLKALEEKAADPAQSESIAALATKLDELRAEIQSKLSDTGPPPPPVQNPQ